MKKLMTMIAGALSAFVLFAGNTGVAVNGVDVGEGSGEGWTYYPATGYVEVTGGGAYVLSGTNTDGKVMFAINDDAEVTLSNLCLKCTTLNECCIWATNDVNVTLFLAGTNTLDASAGSFEAVGVGEGVCIENGTRLTVTTAPGFADEDAVLIAKGSYNRAAIAVGRHGTEGARPFFEIAGGTVYANWFDSQALYSAGIGASYQTGRNGEADIVISGGRVFAKGGYCVPGIGAEDGEDAGAPDILITGGYVEAQGGENAAGIGGGTGGKYGSATVSGGTVRATGGSDASDMLAGKSALGGGGFAVMGGSVVLTRGLANPAPTNALGQTLWCVTVEMSEALGVKSEELVEITGLGDYGTNDLFADGDGKVCLWLPNGDYLFDVKVGGKAFRYEAKVSGANVTATKVGLIFGVTINGRDARLGPDGESGWTLQDGTNVVLDGTREYLLSGANVDDSLTFTAANGATVKFGALALSSAGTVFTVGEGKTLTVAPEDDGSVMSLAGAVDGKMSVTGGRIDLGASSVKDLEVLDGTVSQDAFTGERAVINGGSVRVADLTAMNPVPKNLAGKLVWCVTMPVAAADGTRVTLESAEAGFELPAYYGSKNLFALDGHLHLWLPNGTYKYNADFGYGPIPYTVAVADGHATAEIDYSRYTGVTVNGRDTGLGEYSGCGWKRTKDKYVELDGSVGSYVISGSNDVGNVMIAIAGDANVTLSNLYLKCRSEGECCIWATNGTTVTLFLAGVNTLDASGAQDDMGEGLCIENGTRLTIRNAPGFADEDAVLIARGSINRAAIAVGRHGEEGARPFFEIAGGTVYANWFDSPADWSAGVGSSSKTGKNGEADIVISGGRVFAKGGYGDPGIGAADFENKGAPDIRITGGYVEAVGGQDAAGIGGGQYGKYGSATVSGGTVRATGGSGASDMLACNTHGDGGGFAVTGGSVVLTRGLANPAPTNALGKALWCVTVTNLSPYAAVTLTGIAGYGTNGLFADGDGKVCLWLPNGSYGFTLNCCCGDLHYTATVNGANTFAVLDGSRLSGLKINGRWMLFGPAADDGWEFAGTTLSLTGTGKTYSITNTAASWNGCIDVLADSTVVLEAMTIDASSGNAMRIGDGVSAELWLSGSSTLVSRQDRYAALCVHYGSSLVITNAPDAEVAELHASTQGTDGAAIGGNRQRNCGNITIAGGRIYACSNFRASGIGGGAQSNGSTGTIRITGGYVDSIGGDYGGSGIGSGRRFSSVGYNAPPVIISGGTVKAAGRLYKKTGGWGADIGRGLNNTGGSVTIAGGSVLAVNGRVNPAPTADGKRVWCVTVDVEGVESVEKVVTVEGLGDYGTKDIVAVDGKIYLWLPNGTHGFKVNGVGYHAVVNGANTTAVPGTVTGVTVNGIDVGFGSGTGWTYYPETKYVEVTGRGLSYVLSGTNTEGKVMFAIDADANVTLSDLCLKCTTLGECCIWATNDVNVTLFLAGVNTLDASGMTYEFDVGEGLCIENSTRLTITNAPGFADEDAVLIAKGSKNHAAIAVGRNGTEGTRPFFEIAGGTVYANWFDNPAADWSAGIGASYQTGRNGEADIVISGGRVFAKGGMSDPGIGAADRDEVGASDILITGGYVEAQGGEYAVGIGGGKDGKYGSATVSGGTVIVTGGKDAPSDMLASRGAKGGGGFTVTGGSIVLTRLDTVDPHPAPSNGTDRVWCVTVPNVTTDNPAIEGLPVGYGTKDIVAIDGKICLWLPNGVYIFTVGGKTYTATVDGANTTATTILTPGHSSEPFDSEELAQAAIDSGAVSFAPAPDVVKVLEDSTILTVAGYKEMFAPVVYKSGDEWRVMYELNEKGTNDLNQSVHAVVTNLNLAAIAVAPAEGVDMALKGGVPGFYYTLFKSAAVTNVLTVGAHDKTNSDRLCDKDGIVTFQKVTKPSDAAGFFTVRVSPEQVFTVAVNFPGAIVIIKPIITEWEMARDR